MDELKLYFEVTFKGAETTTTGRFREGYTKRSVVVEVDPRAYQKRDGRAFDEAAEAVARTTADEIAREELTEFSEGVITRLDEFPPVLEDVEPDIDDSETDVRAWLLRK